MKKMDENQPVSFDKFLERVIGTTWAYFDNNYGGKQAEEIFSEYDYYCSHKDEYSRFFLIPDVEEIKNDGHNLYGKLDNGKFFCVCGEYGQVWILDKPYIPGEILDPFEYIEDLDLYQNIVIFKEIKDIEDRISDMRSCLEPSEFQALEADLRWNQKVILEAHGKSPEYNRNLFPERLMEFIKNEKNDCVEERDDINLMDKPER